jgi:hypothetical protein
MAQSAQHRQQLTRRKQNELGTRDSITAQKQNAKLSFSNNAQVYGSKHPKSKFHCRSALDYHAAWTRWLNAVLVHEVGRSLAARCVGGRTEKIILWPLGGFAFPSHDAGPATDFWVACAGTLSLIPPAGVWMLIFWSIDPSGIPNEPIYSESEYGKSIVEAAFWVCLPYHEMHFPDYTEKSASERTCGHNEWPYSSCKRPFIEAYNA